MSETVEVVDAEFSQPSLVPSFNSMESLEPTDSASQVSPNDGPVKFVDWSRPSLQLYEPPGSSTRERKAWFWKHGFEVRQRSTNNKGWACQLCYDANRAIYDYCWVFLDINGSFNITKHLEKRHKIGKEGKMNAPKPLLECFRLAAGKSSTGSEVYSRLISSLDKQGFKNKMMRWIIQDDVPFDIVDSRYFRDLLLAANDSLAEQGLLPCSKIIRERIIGKFAECKGEVMAKLATARGQIHISFDIWTSRNQLCLCGILVHFSDMDGKMHSFLLSLPEVLGRHSGANIAETVIEILREFGISERLGYIVTDNASNNDTAVATLAGELGFNADHRRLRCMGHILNLAARSILFGTNPDALQKTVDEARRDIDEVAFWRQRGPVGKLHNIVKYVYQSPQRIKRFNDIQLLDGVEVTIPAHLAGTSSAKSWNLERDNDTRWNSTYKMIERAVHLRQAVDQFVDEAESSSRTERRANKNRSGPASQKRPSIGDDGLDDEDWAVLVEYNNMLKPFWDATLKLEGDALDGRNGAIWEVLPIFEFLFDELFRLDRRYESSGDENLKMLHTSLQLGIDKLDEYYRLLDLAPVYLAAVILHPKFKWRWIERIWGSKVGGKEWLRDGKVAVRTLWLKEYKDIPLSDLAVDEEPLAAKKVKRDSNISRFFKDDDDCDEDQDASDDQDVDEYERYIKRPQVRTLKGETFNPIAWWQSSRKEFPRLSRMALDLLSIPAMSAKAERIFSQSGNIIRPNRARLGADTVAAVVCLKQWDSEGVIEWN